MVGINVPVIPVEHQYIVTEAHPEIVKRKAQGLPEMGVLRESDSAWYMREEAGGLLLGPYEKGAPACYVDGPSSDSEYELFPEDLDRLAPAHRNRDRARSRVRRGRRQEGLQRRHRLHAGRFADRWTSAGREKLLAQRRPFVRRHRGRRRRLAARRVDRRRRADHRHARRRSAPLRPLRGCRLSHRKERGGLRQGLHRALSRRGARRPRARCARRLAILG